MDARSFRLACESLLRVRARSLFDEFIVTHSGTYCLMMKVLPQWQASITDDSMWELTSYELRFLGQVNIKALMLILFGTAIF